MARVKKFAFFFFIETIIRVMFIRAPEKYARVAYWFKFI